MEALKKDQVEAESQHDSLDLASIKFGCSHILRAVVPSQLFSLATVADATLTSGFKDANPLRLLYITNRAASVYHFFLKYSNLIFVLLCCGASSITESQLLRKFTPYSELPH
jgi:hypothetical protein